MGEGGSRGSQGQNANTAEASKRNRARSIRCADIRREALGRRVDAEQTRSLLDGLVRAGWLKLMTTKTAGRAIHRWRVNPLLFSGAPAPERPERSEREAVSWS